VVEHGGICGGLAADKLDKENDVLVDGAALFSKSLLSDLSGSGGRGASTSGGGKPSSTSSSAGSSGAPSGVLQLSISSKGGASGSGLLTLSRMLRKMQGFACSLRLQHFSQCT
jgi:hypothetical protein